MGIKQKIHQYIRLIDKLYWSFYLFSKKKMGQYCQLTYNNLWQHCKEKQIRLFGGNSPHVVNLVWKPAEYDPFTEKYFPEVTRKQTFLPSYWVLLNNAIVLGEETDCVIHDGEILSDRFYYSPTDIRTNDLNSHFIEQKTISNIIFYKKFHKNISKGIYLQTRWSGNICHFIYDMMLKLIVFDKSETFVDFPILMSKSSFCEKSRYEILDKVNKYNRKIIFLEEGHNYTIQNLIVISLEHYTLNISYENGANWYGGLFNPHSLMLFRDFWKSNDNKTSADKIFITRSNNRRLINEIEVSDYFKSHGFTVIDPGKLSYPKQVVIFKSAKCIVACHGAALSNVVHCHPNTLVIQFTAEPIWQNVDFNNIAYCVGVKVVNIKGNLVTHDGSWTAPGVRFSISIDACNKVIKYIEKNI